ncbi:MAG: Rab family GTPase, partial [Promethearchaeota archaeon]
GQSKFRPMREHFYKGTEGLFLVFDLTLRTSYDNIPNWYQDIRKNLKTSKNLIALILGNKNDLIKERVISKEEAFVLADNLNMEFIETSALTGDNVNNAFYKIAERLLSKNEF